MLIERFFKCSSELSTSLPGNVEFTVFDDGRQVCFQEMSPPYPGPAVWAEVFSKNPPLTSPDGHFLDWREIFGFAVGFDQHLGSGSQSNDRERFSARFPEWFVVTTVAVFGILFSARRIHPKPKSGHYCNCGYDLRASKDRCPECGTPITSSKSSGVESPPQLESPS
jgi:hypothetical protein